MAIDEFTKLLVQAQELGAEGKPARMEDRLKKAEEYIGELGGGDPSDLAIVRAECYLDSIPWILYSAKQLGKKGDAKGLDNLLSQATEYADAIGEDISEDEYNIRTEGYRNAITHLLNSAKHYCEKEDFPLMENQIEQANNYADAIGDDISKDIYSIRKDQSRKGVSGLLNTARQYGEQGEYEKMDNWLEEARKHASRIDQDISRDVSIIKDMGYKKAIPGLISSGKQYGENGELEQMDISFEKAKKLSSEIGEDISLDVAIFKAFKYEDTMPDLLSSAERCANRGHTDTMDSRLQLANKCSSEIGKDISERDAQIRAKGYLSEIIQDPYCKTLQF